MNSHDKITTLQAAIKLAQEHLDYLGTELLQVRTDDLHEQIIRNAGLTDVEAESLQVLTQQRKRHWYHNCRGGYVDNTYKALVAKKAHYTTLTA